LPGCEEIPSEVVEIIKKKTEVDTPLCRVKSGVNGLFVFPSVPSGEYTLVTMSNKINMCLAQNVGMISVFIVGLLDVICISLYLLTKGLVKLHSSLGKIKIFTNFSDNINLLAIFISDFFLEIKIEFSSTCHIHH